MNKYELTNNKKEFNGIVLFQIKSLVDIEKFGVKKLSDDIRERSNKDRMWADGWFE